MTVKTEGEMTLDILVGQVGILRQLPLDDLLAAIQHHQATAPLLDPTAYMTDGSERLIEQERIVRAAIGYRNAMAGAR